MILRPYQNDQVDALRGGFRAGVKRQLLVLGTGGGKTVIFSFMTAGAVQKGLRTLVLAHRSEILDQIEATLTSFDVPWGQIRAGQPMDTTKPVLVASVQTLARRLDDVPVPDFVILDEASHAAAPTWVKVFDRYKDAKWVGVTATPERLDGKGLAPYFEKMVLGPSVQWLIDEKFLKRPRYYGPETALDLSGIKKVAGDYAKNELADVMEKSAITGNAVRHYQRLGRGLPAVVFAVNLKHAASIAEAFNAAGIPSEVIEGSLDGYTRRAMKLRLREGSTKVLVSCELVSEGFDLPAVGCAILLRPTQSLALHLQMIGRALRPSPGQEEAVILDAAGNLLRHGLAEEPRAWNLEGHAAKKREKEAILETRQCSGCMCVYQGTQCPECGLVRVSKLRELRQKEGELREIEAADLASKRARKMEELACRSYADFAALGKARGNKSSWAFFKWKYSGHYRTGRNSLSKKTKPEVVA